MCQYLVKSTMSTICPFLSDALTLLVFNLRFPHPYVHLKKWNSLYIYLVCGSDGLPGETGFDVLCPLKPMSCLYLKGKYNPCPVVIIPVPNTALASGSWSHVGQVFSLYSSWLSQIVGTIWPLNAPESSWKPLCPCYSLPLSEYHLTRDIVM